MTKLRSSSQTLKFEHHKTEIYDRDFPVCNDFDDEIYYLLNSLQWRHNGLDSVFNHRRLDSLLKRLFRRKSKKTSQLRVTGICDGNSPVAGEFLSQRASNAENVSIWWRHHVANYTKLENFSVKS